MNIPSPANTFPNRGGAETDPSFVAPSLVGRMVALRALEPPDYEALYRMAMHPSTLLRWRSRGHTPPFERFVEDLWTDVHSQFAVTLRSNEQVVGLVTAFRADYRNANVQLSVIADPATHGSGVVLEGAALFLDWLFRAFPFRKVYVEAFEFNLTQFGSAVGTLLIEEGRLRDHEFHDDHWWDLIICAIYRDAVERHRERFNLA